MGEVGVGDSADRVVAVLRGAGRDASTVRCYQVILDRFAAFLTGRGVDTASELVCIDFIANQTGVRLGSLHEPVRDRDVHAVRRPVLLMAEVLAGRAIDVDRTVIPVRDGCPARFRPVRDDYLAACRRRGNAEATMVTKGRAASQFLAYLVEVGVDDLAALGVRDVSGLLLRQRGLRRKTIASLRSYLADFLNFLSAAGVRHLNQGTRSGRSYAEGKENGGWGHHSVCTPRRSGAIISAAVSDAVVAKDPGCREPLGPGGVMSILIGDEAHPRSRLT